MARMAGAISDAAAREASRIRVRPMRGAGTGSVRVATEGSSTAAPHRAYATSQPASTGLEGS